MFARQVCLVKNFHRLNFHCGSFNHEIHENYMPQTFPGIRYLYKENSVSIVMLLQRKGILRSDGSSKICCIKFSTPEVKIFLTFCYLLIVMVLLWTSVSIESARFDVTVSAIRTYARCMSGGIREGLDCEPYRRDVEARTNPVLLTVYFTLFSFLSYSNLPFLIQFKTLKIFVVNTARKLSYKRSTSSTI